jgi:hypothetical protein
MFKVLTREKEEAVREMTLEWAAAGTTKRVSQ